MDEVLVHGGNTFHAVVQPPPFHHTSLFMNPFRGLTYMQNSECLDNYWCPEVGGIENNTAYHPWSLLKFYDLKPCDRRGVFAMVTNVVTRKSDILREGYLETHRAGLYIERAKQSLDEMASQRLIKDLAPIIWDYLYLADDPYFIGQERIWDSWHRLSGTRFYFGYSRPTKYNQSMGEHWLIITDTRSVVEGGYYRVKEGRKFIPSENYRQNFKYHVDDGLFIK